MRYAAPMTAAWVLALGWAAGTSWIIWARWADRHKPRHRAKGRTR